MRSKPLTLLILLAILIAQTACGAKPAPTMPAIDAEPTTPTAAAIAPEPAPTNRPAEAAPDPTAAPAVPTTRPGYFSRDQLIEDARQLAAIIESTHPDPYIRGGGKIAFHRRLQRLLEAIPAEGMTRDEFIQLLRPFVAAVGDSHTSIRTSYRVDGSYPGGVPLRFDVVEESLYVAGVPGDEYEQLIGAILVSVEGVPLAELGQRQERLRGAENQYHVLRLLANESLLYRPYMEDLLPEWQDTGQVTVELQLPSGEIEEMVFALPENMSRLHTPNSQVRLPSTEHSGFGYSFIDPEREIAYLRVDHMTFYREDSEVSAAVGVSELTEATRALIPSATETFRGMVIDMEQAGSETLIIDLRFNEGGDSLMSDILIYFLYGKETLRSILAHGPAAGGGEIKKYSSYYFNSRPNVTLESINEGRSVPLTENDYDFAWDFADDPEKYYELVQQSDELIYEWWYQMTATFYAEYESGAYEGYYRPENIVVLVTSGTFSSGFTMARYLYLAGATLVGTPSAQASNCFGNAINWRLDHSGIEGMVSFKYFAEFPDDPEMGRVLPVHYPLTYELLASYDFDPNATYLYALDLLPELGGE